MFSGKGLLIGAVVVIAVIYFGLFFFSTRGYGYPGYRGYSQGSSFWYWGGPRYYYPSRTVRTGSIGGPGRTGGIRAGK